MISPSIIVWFYPIEKSRIVFEFRSIFVNSGKSLVICQLNRSPFDDNTIRVLFPVFSYEKINSLEIKFGVNFFEAPPHT